MKEFTRVISCKCRLWKCSGSGDQMLDTLPKRLGQPTPAYQRRPDQNLLPELPRSSEVAVELL